MPELRQIGLDPAVQGVLFKKKLSLRKSPLRRVHLHIADMTLYVLYKEGLLENLRSPSELIVQSSKVTASGIIQLYYNCIYST